MKHCIALVLLFALTAGNGSASTAADALPNSEDILALSGVNGGLVVVIGNPSSRSEQRLLQQLTQAADGPYSVQLLDTVGYRIDNARKALRAKGIYGKVSATSFDGQQLPYIDNLVNLLVAFGEEQVRTAEMLRVLASGGVLISLQPSASSLQLYTKPWPAEIDE